MHEVMLAAAYLLASLLFILSLRGLSSQTTARNGNFYGAMGMGMAVLATALAMGDLSVPHVLAALIGGALVGSFLAIRVAMTAMPELVALLHSFVGAAAVLVGLASFQRDGPEVTSHAVLLSEIWVDVFIGAITASGSVVAWAKLKGLVGGRPLLLPGRHALNVVLVISSFALLFMSMGAEASQAWIYVLVMAVIAAVLGVHLVVAIGGADMPVVVSLLNSYSGWTASAAGFMLGNDLLIVTGALVGSSGAILSYIMCKAMNRSIWNVVFGGFGAKPPATTKKAAQEGEPLPVHEANVAGTAEWLLSAKKVIVAPGYGMAVARAQHAVREVCDILRDRGCEVTFAIHPVAGRLPGHMNVLLAEAAVPYDIVMEMDEINHEFCDVDVVLVVGANDIVNPSAETDEDSPIYGMPVLKVWDSKQVVICKRSRASGYAGVDNPLFYNDNSAMLFGDARASMDGLLQELRAA
ncbi:MAG: NAD(P)(+) transhydrogenase (Re/Si-specific) subunit beta [Myxococcales bacterium]|nr:NAD(P)(+) transhydrogenase (Re/Si-specific) subunit beta [Myxococcales bacterium]